MTDEQRAREIDALVAQHIMGWVGKTEAECGYEPWPIDDDGDGDPFGLCWFPPDAEEGDIPSEVEHYTTTWQAMGLVVEKMREEGWCWTFGNWTVDRSGPCWYAWLEEASEDGAVHDTSAGTLPVAVCVVALYARGVDVDALRAVGAGTEGEATNAE